MQCRLAAVLTQGAQAQGAAQPRLETPPKEPCRLFAAGHAGVPSERQHLPDANNGVWQRLAATHPIQGVQALPCMQSIVPQQKRRQAVIVMPLAWWHRLACPQGIHTFSGLPRERLLAMESSKQAAGSLPGGPSNSARGAQTPTGTHLQATMHGNQGRRSRARRASALHEAPRGRAAWRQRTRRLRPPDPASFPLVGPRVQETCQESSQEPSIFLFHHELG